MTDDLEVKKPPVAVSPENHQAPEIDLANTKKIYNILKTKLDTLYQQSPAALNPRYFNEVYKNTADNESYQDLIKDIKDANLPADKISSIISPEKVGNNYDYNYWINENRSLIRITFDKSVTIDPSLQVSFFNQMLPMFLDYDTDNNPVLIFQYKFDLGTKIITKETCSDISFNLRNLRLLSTQDYKTLADLNTEEVFNQYVLKFKPRPYLPTDSIWGNFDAQKNIQSFGFIIADTWNGAQNQAVLKIVLKPGCALNIKYDNNPYFKITVNEDKTITLISKEHVPFGDQKPPVPSTNHTNE